MIDANHCRSHAFSLPPLQNPEHGPSPLHKACQYGFYDIVVLLMAHPDIRVNQKNELGWTPFSLACANGRTEVVKLMLKDERVNINTGNKLDQTPLWIAAYWGKIDVVKVMFASGRKIDDCSGPRRMAREKEINDIWALIREFMETPAETVARLREELRWLGNPALSPSYPSLSVPPPPSASRSFSSVCRTPPGRGVCADCAAQ